MKEFRTSVLVLLLSLFTSFIYSQDLEEAKVAYNEGVEQFNQDQLETAMESFLKCVGICEMLEEEESLETKMLASNAIPGLQLRIAGKFIQDNNFEEGIPALEKTIEYSEKYNDGVTKSKAEGQLTKVYAAYAKNLLKNEKFDEADEYFNKIIAIDPNDASVYLFKAIMYKQQGMVNPFKENLMKSIEIAKNTSDRKTEKIASDQGSKYFLKNAMDAFNSNKFDECITNLETSLEFDSNQPDALFYMIVAFNKLSKWDDAISSGEKALNIENRGDEKKAAIYYEMANAFKEKGENTQACENYKNAMFGQYLENAKYQIEHILKCAN